MVVSVFMALPPASYTTKLPPSAMKKRTPNVEPIEEKVKTSIKIDPSLWTRAKITAIQNKMELSTLVENGLKAELDKLKKESEERLKVK